MAERLSTDYGMFFEQLAYIVDKKGDRVHPKIKPGQRALLDLIDKQESQGKPVRIVILKARQIGYSTLIQSIIMQRCLTRANEEACCVAHDRTTGSNFFRIGQRIYDGLPEGEGIKPEVLSHRRSRYLHFGSGGQDAQRAGTLWPDSSYLVDTAGEFHAGRGHTFRSVHASELAFWSDASSKLTSLKSAVPDVPNSMFLIESTAQGHNDFADVWEEALNGDSDYEPLFWPWHAEPDYSRPFADQAEQDEFRVGEGRRGEGEKDLVDGFGLSIEQLNWRRHTIANQCSGKLDVFRQEYPATPTEAFISSDNAVFDSFAVQRVVIETEQTDPATPGDGGPMRGILAAKSYLTRRGRGGHELEVPENVTWKPRSELAEGLDAPWKVWPQDGEAPKKGGHYVIGVDVSGQEVEEISAGSSWHAIEVVDHESREQVAEYRSHCDLSLLTEQVYLAAMLFNDAWVVVEVTGGWGRPVARKLWLDYRFPFCYFRPSAEGKKSRKEARLGWDTSQRSRPALIAGVEDALRDGTHGIKSAALAKELQSFIRTPSGKQKHSPGKHDDLLMSWAIAKYCCDELIVRKQSRATRYSPPQIGIGQKK